MDDEVNKLKGSNADLQWTVYRGGNTDDGEIVPYMIDCDKCGKSVVKSANTPTVCPKCRKPMITAEKLEIVEYDEE